MARKRTTYDAEFKLQAVRMITDPQLSLAEVARRLGVGENLLHTWRKASRQHGEASFPGDGQPTPADERRRLRSERALLTQAADFVSPPR